MPIPVLADGLLGTPPVTAVLQWLIAGWLHPGIGMASLARLTVGVFPFFGLERVILAGNLYNSGDSLERGQHTMGIGIQSMVRRIPMMLGPLAGDG
jgi:hypothetical protein